MSHARCCAALLAGISTRRIPLRLMPIVAVTLEKSTESAAAKLCRFLVIAIHFDSIRFVARRIHVEIVLTLF